MGPPVTFPAFNVVSERSMPLQSAESDMATGIDASRAKRSGYRRRERAADEKSTEIP
jgi:hypothetical protein